MTTRFRRLGLGSGACRGLDAARTQHIVRDAPDYVHQPKNWHQTGTSQTQKAKKSAGANLLTLVFLGSPTWARTRDLRINSPSLYRLSYQGTSLAVYAENGPVSSRSQKSVKKFAIRATRRQQRYDAATLRGARCRRAEMVDLVDRTRQLDPVSTGVRKRRLFRRAPPQRRRRPVIGPRSPPTDHLETTDERPR